ncbi:ABC transporter permease [Mesotoga sp.]|uniref:ABC transporter permease n=1 Tax=Mesotoga sp. TaxID=2053577 RepID=UPI00168F2B4D|nr:ABC transporter permease [Mesotoga sp.]MDI9369095.1 ABC transporter permease [Thermotogota bacterium]NLT46037.1 ABC transporter permease [Thermotogaceae bacterium]MDD3680043.1 ABC transporter permease [Mesotoga sp.]MDD4206979.1 ABC transporter permease [Mesotoga sp.]MDD5682311.1 ABC transporter permease [Mesotoga sp.]
MSLKRIFNIFRIDVVNGSRDKMVIYILLTPIIFSFFFRVIAPGFQTLSLNFVTISGQEETAEILNKFGDIEFTVSEAELKERVEEATDVIGIYYDGESFNLVLQGNESKEIEEAAKLILSGIQFEVWRSLEVEESNKGRFVPPITVFGFSFVVIISFVLGGMVIGFNIIEEKESGAMRALMVTPITKNELIFGRSIMGIVIPLFHALVATLIFDIPSIDYLKLMIVCVVSSMIGIVFGFLIGVVSSSQMSGIANMKISGWLLLMPVMLAFILPERAQWIFFWSPTYWSFVALRDILNLSSKWSGFAFQIFWICLTTAILFLLMKSKIKRGLQTYQN